MMKRTCGVLLLLLTAYPTLARAADDPPSPPRLLVRVVPEVVARPRALVGLYTAFSGLQAYDTYSTLSSVNGQQAETNPLVSGLVKQPVIFIAVKSVVTLAAISAAEGLWRTGHPGRAIVLMVVSSGAMAVIAARNASALRGER